MDVKKTAKELFENQRSVASESVIHAMHCDYDKYMEFASSVSEWTFKKINDMLGIQNTDNPERTLFAVTRRNREEILKEYNALWAEKLWKK